MMQCPSCGHPLVAKNRLLLLVVGLLLIASVAAARINWLLLAPTGFLALIGVYLVVWSTVGRGLWCRTCKRFPIQ